MRIALILIMTLAFMQTAVFANTNQDQNSNGQAASAQQYMSDSKITLAVKAKLLADKDIKSTDISVTTENGVVTLTGTVPDAMQKDKAAKIAQDAEGVKSVVNNLQLSPEVTH